MTSASASKTSPTVAERAAHGREARKRASRSCHGWFDSDADADRTDPIEVIERQSATRVPELVPIRYGRMLESRSASTGARRPSWRRTSAPSPTPA
jgi:hypothetical protein